MDFGEDDNLSNIVASNTQSDKFQSLIVHTNMHGRLSIPHLLGLNIPSITKILITAVYQKYPHLYPHLQPIYKIQQETSKALEVVQSKAKRLRKELENESSNTLIRSGLIITAGETKCVNYDEFMVVLMEYKQTKQLLYNANRQIKRLKEKLNKYECKDDVDNEEDSNNYEKSATIYINEIIKESKLGSTLLVSTEQFLYFILQQSCNYCGETRFHYKKLKVSTVGFSVRVTMICKTCETSNEFTNESPETNFNMCFTTAGLIGGTNRRSLQMVFACVGITLQLCKKSFYRNQALVFEKIIQSSETSAEIVLQKVIDYHKIKNKKIIQVSFDCSWSHVHNALQASGEIIYDGRDIEGNFFFTNL